MAMTSTVVRDQGFRIDARLVGLGAAALALRFKANFLAVVIVAALTTALVRAL
jgi:hypothetical protein